MNLSYENSSYHDMAEKTVRGWLCNENILSGARYQIYI